MTSDEKDEEMICALTQDEHRVLQSGLEALADTMPPRTVWCRIREQAEAEGLFTKPRSRRPSTWYVGGSIAAAAALVAFLVPVFKTETYTTPGPDTVAGSQMTDLQALQVESRRLEQDLLALPSEPKVKRASTQATILEIEDRIAARSEERR